MPDGHIRMENPKTGDYIDFPKSAEAQKPLPDNGWQTYAGWVNSGTNRLPVLQRPGRFRLHRLTTMDRRSFNLTR